MTTITTLDTARTLRDQRDILGAAVIAARRILLGGYATLTPEAQQAYNVLQAALNALPDEVVEHLDAIAE